MFHADVPLLLVFSESPTAIALRPGTDGGQFVITFASPTATTALLPLYGHDIQAAAITEQWLATFPSAVKDRCDVPGRSASARIRSMCRRRPATTRRRIASPSASASPSRTCVQAVRTAP